MDLERADLDAAVERQILTAPQAAALWTWLAAREVPASAAAAPNAAPLTDVAAAPPAPAESGLTGHNVAYWFGALLVIGAMGWLMTLGFEDLGPWGLFSIAVAYALCFALAGRSLLRAAETSVPGGLLVTMAVCMTPLAVFGLERGTGFWPAEDPGSFRDFYPAIRGSWVFMEAATVLAALVAVRRVRFSFLMAPLSVALWFMSMDFAALHLGIEHWDYTLVRPVSIAFGLAMLFAALIVDRVTAATPRGEHGDHAFWLYLFGMVTFWFAISTLESDSEWRRFLYCLLNLGFVVLGALLRRRVFLVFGAIGVNAYLVREAWEVFKDSMLFPFALTLLGLAVIATAVEARKRRAELSLWAVAWLPSWLRELAAPRT